MSTPRERRKYRRVEIKWPVTIMTPDGPKSGQTKNIGVGGALLACKYPLPLHERVCVIFEVPGREPVVINTMVARSNVSRRARENTRSEVALYYIDLSDQELHLLQTEVSKASSKALPHKGQKCPGCGENVNTFKVCRDCGIVTCTGCLRAIEDGTSREASVACPECGGSLV